MKKLWGDQSGSVPGANIVWLLVLLELSAVVFAVTMDASFLDFVLQLADGFAFLGF